MEEQITLNIETIEIPTYPLKDSLSAYKYIEQFAKQYYEKLGWNVILWPNITHKDIIEKFVKIIDYMAGMPDLFIWKGNEYYFVEVKSENDGVRFTQLEWFNAHLNTKKKIVRFVNYPLNKLSSEELNEITKKTAEELSGYLKHTLIKDK